MSPFFFLFSFAVTQGLRWKMGSVRRHAEQQCTFREMKWHKQRLPDSSPGRRRLNALNSCVKVSVVVIDKHGHTDLLFDERSRSKCHLTERFFESCHEAARPSPRQLANTASLSFSMPKKRERETGSAGCARARETGFSYYSQ